MGFGLPGIGGVPGLGWSRGTGGGLQSLLLGPGLGPTYAHFNKISALQQFQANKANAYQTMGLNALARGFGKAKTAVSQGAGVAKQSVQDVAQKTGAAAQENRIGRGLYGTNALESANRGIGSDLAKHLAWIDAQAGEALGGLETEEASAMAHGYGGLASLAQGFGEQQTALGASLFPYLQQQGLLGPLLGIGGQILGAHS